MRSYYRSKSSPITTSTSTANLGKRIKWNAKPLSGTANCRHSSMLPRTAVLSPIRSPVHSAANDGIEPIMGMRRKSVFVVHRVTRLEAGLNVEFERVILGK